MFKNTKFNGERLKNSRLYRGLTLTELAAKTKISKQSLSLYENGTNSPDLDKVMTLSQQLNFPYTFFFRENAFTIKTEATYFRSLLSTTKKDRTAQSVKLEFIAQMYEVLCSYVDFPVLNLPKVIFDGGNDDYAYESANEVVELETIAMQTRTHWGLGMAPIKDLKYLLESNGIFITCFFHTRKKLMPLVKEQ